MKELTSPHRFPTRQGRGSLSSLVIAVAYLFCGICSPPVVAAVPEAPGPSSRKTPIAITEIMYKPAPRGDSANLEFIEIYNSNPFFHDIGGYRLEGDKLNYTFPAGTIISSNAYFVIAASPADMQQVYGLVNVFGPYSGSLKKSETLRLIDEQGSVLLTIPYSDSYPWPVAADGTGHSIVLANPTYGEADPRAWDISDAEGGSPGKAETYVADPLRDVVINEWLAHTEDPGTLDFIELYNHSPNTNDISGCILTDNYSTNRFTIPDGTLIRPGEFVAFDQNQLGFGLKASGQTLFFLSPGKARVLDAVQFEAQADQVSFGRWPDGANAFYPLATRTPGAANTAPRVGDIVINELMYDPISGNDDDQFIELYNRGSQPINLAGWKFTSGVTYTFPANVTVAPDGYLVVARNVTNLLAKYPNLNQANSLGNYSGKLTHNGDRVALAAPQVLTSETPEGPVTTTIYVVEDEVTYGAGGRWGVWAAGGGSSLELIDPRSNHRLAANWADSDDTAKSVWANFEVTGMLDNGANYEASIAHAQFGLLDVGECLVDNLEVRAGTDGPNLVTNPDFENGVASWSMQGCFARSSLESSGFQSARSLHVRSSDRIWTGVNSCQMNLKANTLSGGQIATLRFQARWLHGWPEPLMRLNGNWLELTGALPIPANLGTPGARNSRSVANAGPAIYDVIHSPTLPAANQFVVVTARVHDPDGLQAVTLNYRVDPTKTYTSLEMHDDGLNNDAVAGDGLFSATIPGQTGSKLVAFYISATDSQSAATRFPALANDNATPPECVVGFNDANPKIPFGVYHLWVTQTNSTRWTSLSDLSNESHDCTFVTGSRVIYNTKARWSGSPYHQSFDTPYGNLCHYKWTFPDDDKFLGATSFNKIHQPGNGAGDDGTIQREQTAHLFLRALGVPWLNRRYVAVYVNGRKRGSLMEDTQTPDGDVVKQWFPNDDNGYLYKMQPWFEFAPTPSGASIGFNNNSWVSLMPFTTTGGAQKTARYRYNFLSRRTPDSASNYDPVFALIDAAGTFGSPNYVANMENLADMENWMRVFAANHAAGNWDSFGAQNGQNLYGYMGTRGSKYSLFMWDYNIVLGNISWGPGENLFAVNGSDPNTGNIYDEPTFRRMYWRALQELVNGPLNVTNTGPLLDAKFKAFGAAGVSVQNPNPIKSFLTTARLNITSQIAAENTSTFTIDPTVTVNNGMGIITGTAPFVVKTIRVNEIEWPVTWTSVTAWKISVPLQAGQNTFDLVGVTRRGERAAGASGRVSVTYNSTPPSPVGNVVFNEIMNNPARPGAGYVELFNASTKAAFDLSGFEIPELSYTFPDGSFIAANSYLVLAEDRLAFAEAYGSVSPVFDAYKGSLNATGQTLSLVKPGPNGSMALTVAKLRYESKAPWPATAASAGSSLQLIDPAQNISRPDNWSLVASNVEPPGPQWQYVTLTGIATKSLLLIGMTTAGDVYVDDMKLVAGDVPEAGQNMLDNSDFESPLTGRWTVSDNMVNSQISSEIKHSGNSSLHVVATSGGPTIQQAIWQNTATLVTNATYTLSYWYLPSDNGSSLLIRLSGSMPNRGHIYSLQPYAPPPVNSSLFTPGGANSVKATLPAFPSLWINEVAPNNVTGLSSGGAPAPWIEIHNSGSSTISLAGFFLSSSYANLGEWAFPAGAEIKPGEFKVIFADGRTDLSTAQEPHTSFALKKGGGALALNWSYNGAKHALDYLNYPAVAADHSYGSYPDAQRISAQEFSASTPGQPNQPGNSGATITINEWLADNAHGLINPVGGQHDDWFELHNFGAGPVDLAGYFLTDDLSSKFKYQIPPGHSILANGYLLIWADKQSSATGTDLHVNFKLNKGGSSLGLFAPDGSAVDSITFGSQSTDVSGGRSPDSGPDIRLLSPTPGAANASPNTQPSIADAPPQYLYAGQTLRLAIRATDADQPPQHLRFLLDPGFPEGAAISPDGILTWPTSLAQHSVSTEIPVRVIDDGIPPQTRARSFQVVVLPPPGLTALQKGTGKLTLEWPGYPGKTYQIEFKDDLNAPQWTPLAPAQLQNGSILSIEIEVDANASRFYRLAVTQ